MDKDKANGKAQVEKAFLQQWGPGMITGPEAGVPGSTQGGKSQGLPPWATEPSSAQHGVRPQDS